MSAATESPTTPLARGNFQIRIFSAVVALYQLVALLVLGALIFSTVSWLKYPFIGAFVEHTLMVNTIQPVHPNTWNARNAGFEFGDQLLAMAGVELQQLGDFYEQLDRYQPGDEVAITARTLDGEIITRPVVLQRLSRSDLFANMIIPWIIGLVYVGSGLWVFSLRYKDASGRGFALFTASAAIAIAGIFDIHTYNRFTYLWTASLAIAGGAIFNLSWVFPQESRRFRKTTFFQWLGYFMGGCLLLWALPALFNMQRPTAYIGAWRLEYAFLGLVLLFFVGVAAYRRYTSTAPLMRQQGRIIVWGALISFLPISIWFLVTATRPEIRFSAYLLVPLIVFPLAVAYAILRYRLLNTDYAFSRLIMYALLTAIAVSGYALMVSGLSLALGGATNPTNPLLVGLMVFILAALFNPLRTYLQQLVDTLFFRGQRAYQEQLRKFGQDLSPAVGLDEIGALLRQYVEESINPAQLHIFTPDSLSDYYIALPDASHQRTTDLSFATTSVLPGTLERNKNHLFIGGGVELHPALESEKARIALLGAQIFTPLLGRDTRLIGFMALTARKTGEPYGPQDLEYLSSLSDQAAIAIERNQVISVLERRVNDMNVLMRVSEGINVTQHFDDILELVYAQTNRLISLRDFWILLYNDENDSYKYAFYLVDDIRSLEHENRPVEPGLGLAREVVRTRRPIVIDDYRRECRKRGFTPAIEGLFAWMGIPLNAGSKTIGSLSLASRDPSVVYSSEQVSLIQAIAEQVAGAIFKMRLLQETERRARQLSLLNEISRNLTSTLDLTSLLQLTLQHAIEIINCEAGTLFLIDEETGELIFEVVLGPVADELVGQRLPPGTGHVGRAVTSRQPAIVNGVNRTEEWASKPDERTGFQTRDLLLVPMSIQNTVLGVIEVINRRDGSPFTHDDLELLASFTSQAAIALENARLYTRTDKQLEARVDELSVMQRIDRELNASLNIKRAMQITLNWAMSQSGADAGLVGAVDEDAIQVMAERGYEDEILPYNGDQLPLDALPALRRAFGEADTQIMPRLIPASENTPQGFLTGARSQVVFPIRREEKVIGILLLESRSVEPLASDTQEFLSRLSDHAAIAIANAQLFGQVRDANKAKTDFISFVAHELKTPMTSIRGYTDLLMGGAMGAITEGQENFLQTIRSNVNRMATLVSDLNDMSRIEVGHLSLDFNAVDIADVVNEVARSQQHAIDAKQQSLQIEIPAGLPPVWGDRTRLVQILGNLVSNANKYSPEGGVITIHAETPSGEKSDAPKMLRVAVEDNGIGMAPEDQEKIFSQFFRSEDPAARLSPGSGLGLHITKNLIEMQGGGIWFESQYRKGTTFFIAVPIAESVAR